ncbi:MAG: hypothetical protein C1941_04215 [Prosthecochloris sp.]|nr:hypothetical protein [Prosthecochloris sp.]
MSRQQLHFFKTGSYPFPYKTRGSDTALTVSYHKGEPSLAFLTQTGHEADIVFLRLYRQNPEETGRFSSPKNYWRISGMAYDRAQNRLWATEGSGSPHEHADSIIGIDADSGAHVDTIIVPFSDSHALAFNGQYFLRSDGSALEMIDRAGNILATLHVPIGSNCRGLSSAPWTYIASDTLSNKLVILSLFGQVVAECDAPPGEPGGIEAVAFDGIQDYTTLSQFPESSVDPAIPWSPDPWNFRHTVYLANQKDQTIYFGYFY